MAIKNKLLIVYNTCGIRKERENIAQYISHLGSIGKQNAFDEHKLIISGCCNSEECKNQVNSYCSWSDIDFNWIDNIYPISVTFNDSVLKSVKKYGEFEGYLYIDSGVSFQSDDDLGNLYDLFKSDDNGMVAARTTTDSGLAMWFGLSNDPFDTSLDHKLFDSGDFQIPISKTVNLHCQIFSNSIYRAYGRILPDIFAGHCMESVFSYMCAGVNERFVLSKDVIVNHIVGMDLGSAGFDTNSWAAQGRPTWDHPYLIPSIIERLSGSDGLLGYEEVRGVIKHNPDMYYGNYCKEPHTLKKFIKQRCFLQQNELDYNHLN